MTDRHPELLSEEDLLPWLGYSQRGKLEERLRQLGVPIIPGRGGRICTTKTALNAALGVSESAPRPEPTPDFL